MDEYLSEKEQIEQIRQWWSDYGWYVLGGVVIALLGLFGYQRYQDSVAASADAASALYRELDGAVEDDDLSEAQRLLATLQAEHQGSPYTDNAALRLASALLVSDTEQAIAALRSVLDGSSDAELAMIARMRLARVLAWRERYDEALELLAVDEPGPFAARISEIRGDVLLASGDNDGARTAFAAALVLPGSEFVDRSFLQMKLGSLDTVSDTAAISSAPAVDLEAIEAADDPGEAP